MSAASVILPSLSLARREWTRFLRQRNRVVGALATPLVFWLLLGTGLGRSFSGPGAGEGYLQYFFPGVLLMIVLFTAIFSTISIIEDRREGFLQSVLVAPVGRGAIALGKILGGTALATGQAALFLLLAPLAGVSLSAVQVLATLAVLAVLGVALTATGLALAWRMTSTQGFHVVMNLLLMPAWMLSGAVFPLRDDTPLLMKIPVLANPLSYGCSLLRTAMGESPSLPAGTGLSLAVTHAFAAGMTLLAIRVASSSSRADLLNT